MVRLFVPDSRRPSAQSLFKLSWGNVDVMNDDAGVVSEPNSSPLLGSAASSKGAFSNRSLKCLRHRCKLEALDGLLKSLRLLRCARRNGLYSDTACNWLFTSVYGPCRALAAARRSVVERPPPPPPPPLGAPPCSTRASASRTAALRSSNHWHRVRGLGATSWPATGGPSREVGPRASVKPESHDLQNSGDVNQRRGSTNDTIVIHNPMHHRGAPP